MAQRVITVLEDDVDGSQATQSVSFSLDGHSYVVDLNDQNAAALRAALEPWRKVARPDGHRRPTIVQAQARSRHHGMIRQWGADNGWELSPRGRIPQDLLDAFCAAHRAGPGQV